MTRLLRSSKRILTGVLLGLGLMSSAPAQNVRLLPSSSPEGYLARLLINETAFPGEKGYRSEEDSMAGMEAILWVLHCRIHHVPEGYTQREIAAVETRSLIDVMTAGGQLEGFYRDAQGRPRAAARVHRRVHYLVTLANQGEPGRVSRLLNHAQKLASSYSHAGPGGPEFFKDITRINRTPVTGRPYSWMSDAMRYSPGGSFVRIPNAMGGLLGGNRFFTLRADR